MKDIVKRLHDVNLDGSGSARVDMICVEAAEEIERLRKALEPFSKFADALNEAVPDNIAVGIYADGSMRFGPGHGVSVKNMREARASLQPVT